MAVSEWTHDFYHGKEGREKGEGSKGREGGREEEIAVDLYILIHISIRIS